MQPLERELVGKHSVSENEFREMVKALHAAEIEVILDVVYNHTGGCAKAFREAGADLAITYLNEKAERFVRPLAESLDAPIIVPCDLRIPGQLEALFLKVSEQWGELDFVLHSIAFAPKKDLHGRVVDCSESGFLLAMQVSCHSFIRMARLAEPLMQEGGALLTVTFYGSEKAVED